MKTPRVEPFDDDGRPGLIVRADYHQGFVAELKEEIPPTARSWNGVSRWWWVDEEYRGTLEHLLLSYFGLFEYEDPDTGRVRIMESV